MWCGYIVWASGMGLYCYRRPRIPFLACLFASKSAPCKTHRLPQFRLLGSNKYEEIPCQRFVRASHNLLVPRGLCAEAIASPFRVLPLQLHCGRLAWYGLVV